MLFVHSQKGQGIIEYVLILVLVTMVVLVSLLIFGPALGNIFSNIITQL